MTGYLADAGYLVNPVTSPGTNIITENVSEKNVMCAKTYTR